MLISATLNMPKLIPVLDKETIAHNVDSIAKQISADYHNHELVLVCVLKGAFVFTADLIRQLELNIVTIEFVRLSSYGDGTDTSGKMRLLMDVETDLSGRHVLIVEDILDTGLTLEYLVRHLKAKGPKEVKTCVLLDKRERRQIDFQPDYSCHTTKEGFLVGYGLDCAEAYRNLPGIYKLNC